MRNTLVFVIASAFAAAAAAQQPAAPPPAFASPNVTPKGVASMAAACAMCHGTQGSPVAGSPIARLSSRPAEQIVTAMREFREGKREATIMHQIARGYSEPEVAALAKYFEAQRGEGQ